MQRTQVGRCGMTRIEVVVLVVACLAVLFLFLPAVNGPSRGPGRRTMCTNNLYQLALATIRWEDKHGFTPGWRNASPNDADAVGKNAVSWPVVILPFIERQDIYLKWSGGDPEAPPMSIFLCPSSPPKDPSQPTLAYAGNVGSGANTRRWDGVMLDTTDEESGRVRLEDISKADGTLSTVLLAERCASSDYWHKRPVHQYWWDRQGVTVPNDSGDFFENIAAYKPFAPSPRPGIGIAGKPAAGMKIINNATEDSAPGFWSQPSSNHVGGVVMAFCDGHTTFVLETIDAAVYAQLLSSDRTKASDISRIDWGADTHPVLKDADYH